ncbi:MAG: cysteine desulfurase, partial [Cyanobacteria bacterium]|nr:cysteine desulfurase [Cyanobacteriota bacterium]
DNAATSQKPKVVIQAITDYYMGYNANIHRGVHTLSEEATEAFEAVRHKVRAFIDAQSEREIIFTKNATESINLVISSWGRHNIQAGDEIVLSAMEHHSNFVGWQQLAEERGARLVFLELTDDGRVDMEHARSVIGERTKVLAITQMSNVLGTIPPLKELIALAKANGAVTLVDGAQGVAHLPTSVRDLGCDFLVFSFHKMLGPTGVGVLYGREELLNSMPPFMYGGDMISAVHRDRTKFNQLPYKFEAGTPNIADVIASGVALEYLSAIGMERIREHEIEITSYALEQLSALDGITIYGPTEAREKGGVISFNYAGIHPHDIGQLLDERGVAVRAGHHCCQPLMDYLKIQGTARASFYIYNTLDEIDILVDSLKEAGKIFGHVAR